MDRPFISINARAEMSLAMISCSQKPKLRECVTGLVNCLASGNGYLSSLP